KRKLYDEFGDIALQTGFDAKKAREYRDAVRSGGFTGGGGPQGFGGFEGFDWTEAAGGGGGVDFEDLFGDLFSGFGGGGRGGGRGRRAQRGPAPGDDIEASLDLDFVTAVKGGHTHIALEKPTQCKSCDGTGSTDKKRTRCPDCGGSGRVPTSRGPLRMESVCEHPVFKREGDDLSVDVPITIPEAISGATVSFPTPSGEVSLKIPPGTQS